MTGREIMTTYMTSDEIRRWEQNMNLNQRISRYMLNKEYYNLPHTFITGSFPWDTTTEGSRYWMNISDRILKGEKNFTPPRHIKQHTLI